MMLRAFSNMARLVRAERQSPQERNAERLDALNTLISHAREQVPLYRSRLKDTGKLSSLGDITQLPRLSKADLLANFPDQVRDQATEASSLYQIATSGTSNRVMVFHDEAKRNWDRAADLLVKRRTEGFGRILTIPPDDCYERCGLGGQVPSIGSTLLDAMAQDSDTRTSARRSLISRVASRVLWNDHLETAPGVDGSAVDDATIDRFFAAVTRVRPQTVRAFPYYLYLLAQRANGRTFDPCTTVRPTGGKASGKMIEIIESRLQVKYRENYGSAELGTISMDDRTGRKQRLFEPLFLLEIVRNGKPVEPGEIGEMLVTDLRNRACPLIRYEVGDVGRWLPADDRGGETFEVLGRLDETIVRQDGIVVPADTLVDAMISTPGAGFSKLRQLDGERFVVEVAPSAEALDDSQLKARLSAELGPNASIDIRRVKRIAPESSGKYRLVESRSFQEFHAAGEETPVC